MMTVKHLKLNVSFYKPGSDIFPHKLRINTGNAFFENGRVSVTHSYKSSRRNYFPESFLKITFLMIFKEKLSIYQSIRSSSSGYMFARFIP